MSHDKLSNDEVIAVLNSMNESLKSYKSAFDAYVIKDEEWKKQMGPIFSSIPELTSVGEGVKAWRWMTGSIGNVSKLVLAITAILVALGAIIKLAIKYYA